MAHAFTLDAKRRSLLEILLHEQQLGALPGGLIPRLPDDALLPLSFAQRRLWFLARLESDAPTYNLPVALELHGPLDVMLLQQALTFLVERHTALRTVFVEVDGTPYQVVQPPSILALPVLDLREIPMSTRHTQASAQLLDEVRRPFDLMQGPALRAMLMRTDTETHLLVLNQHHIVSDGWSNGLLIRELVATYAALAVRERVALPALPIRYGDYAAWEREQLQGTRLEAALAYWRAQLSGAPTLLDLPTDYARPVVSSSRGGRVMQPLSPELAQALRSLSSEQGVTLFMTMLTAFAVLLYRLSGQEDLLIGSPITNRSRAELEGVVGLFVNTLVLRANFTGNPTFHAALSQVREMVLGANAHRDVPFDMLVEMVRPERTLGATPLFQVMFDLQSEPPPLTAAGVMFRFLDPPEGIAKFDLTLDIIERGTELVTAIEYDADLFTAETVQRMLARYETLLAALIQQPHCPIASLPLLPAAERRLLVETWNATTEPRVGFLPVHERFAAHAVRQPDASAVTGLGQALTYVALNTQANQLAHYLRTLDIGPEAPVGICLNRSPLLLVGVLGVLKAGGAYVPLDPDYPADRLAYMLADSGATVLLTESTLLAQLPQHTAHVIALDVDMAVSAQPATTPTVSVTPETLAYIIYTSGTTGRPKGTAIPHRALENAYCAWERAYDLPTLRAHLQMASFSFDVFTGDWVRALCSGGKLALCPRETLLAPAQLYALLLQEEVDAAEFVPAVMRALVEHLELTEERLEFMRLLVVGSDVWREDEYSRFRRLCGPQTRLINSYGVTEATIDSTYFEATLPGTGGTLPIGRPFANMRLYILDAQLMPVPVGLVGELFIGGDGVARGYHAQPALTAERFVPDLFGPPGARLYRTGDRARYRSDGQVEFLGRADTQIKLRGYRIEVGEIETVLARHPQIDEAVVTVQESDGRKLLAAYVKPVSDLDVATLRHWLLERLPDYMTPGLFAFLDAFPLTPNGKVDRQALPVVAYHPRDAQSVAPRDVREAVLARVWAEVLGLEQVSVHDNFFELGGDSILSLQIIARARGAGVHFTPRQLFQHQTIAELAAVAGIATTMAEQGPVTGVVPLTPIQRWFFEADFAAPHHWNQAVLLEVREPWVQPALARVVAALLEHHDALRMCYCCEDGQWQQISASPGDAAPCEWVDFAQVSDPEIPAALAPYVARAQAGLNLTDGPLFHIVYFDLGPARAGRLLLVAHHLVMDAVSLRILIADLQTAYSQVLENAPVVLPPKSTSFKQWAEKLTAYAHAAPELVAERDYWASITHQQVSPLPLDYPFTSAANCEGQMDWLTAALDAEETRALLQDVPAAYNTQINDILLTALVLALEPWSGERCLLVDTEGHGREDLFADVDLSRTVGWFTSVYPVWLDLRAAPRLDVALKAVKEQLRAIPRRGIGYGLLRYLRPEGEQFRAAAQIAFNYLGQFGSGRDTSAELFCEAAEDFGPLHSPQATRPYLLEVEAYISQGQLRVRWTYSRQLHRRETVERLAAAYQAALQEIIAHCLMPEAGGYTPSDFPEAALSQDDLDALLAEFAELA